MFTKILDGYSANVVPVKLHMEEFKDASDYDDQAE